NAARPHAQQLAGLNQCLVLRPRACLRKEIVSQQIINLERIANRKRGSSDTLSVGASDRAGRQADEDGYAELLLEKRQERDLLQGRADLPIQRGKAPHERLVNAVGGAQANVSRAWRAHAAGDSIERIREESIRISDVDQPLGGRAPEE